MQCSEVLSSLKPDSSMGGAVPELMEGGAMGVAAVGVSRSGKGFEDSKFFFREAAQGMK